MIETTYSTVKGELTSLAQDPQLGATIGHALFSHLTACARENGGRPTVRHARWLETLREEGFDMGQKLGFLLFHTDPDWDSELEVYNSLVRWSFYARSVPQLREEASSLLNAMGEAGLLE